MSAPPSSRRSLIFIIVGIATLIYVAFLPFGGKDGGQAAGQAEKPAAPTPPAKPAGDANTR